MNKPSMPGTFLDVLLNTLQSNFFLPPVFSNTTMGAIALRATIESGSSTILQSILHMPEVKQYLVHCVHSTFVSDESFGETEVSPESAESALSFAALYGTIKSSNAVLILHHLVANRLLRIHVLSPRFFVSGWSELMPTLFCSPSPIVMAAYNDMVSSGEDVNGLLTKQQRVLMTPRHEFLHRYYLQQLQEEYHLLITLVEEFPRYFTDEYSVEDWLQGLIELENLSSSFLLHADLLVRETVDDKERFQENSYQSMK